MKKLLLLGGIVLLAMSSCSKDEAAETPKADDKTVIAADFNTLSPYVVAENDQWVVTITLEGAKQLGVAENSYYKCLEAVEKENIKIAEAKGRGESILFASNGNEKSGSDVISKTSYDGYPPVNFTPPPMITGPSEIYLTDSNYCIVPGWTTVNIMLTKKSSTIEFDYLTINYGHGSSGVYITYWDMNYGTSCKLMDIPFPSGGCIVVKFNSKNYGGIEYGPVLTISQTGGTWPLGDGTYGRTEF